MPKYEVTFKGTAFTTYVVEADSSDDAREKVYNGEADVDETEYDDDWGCINVEEIE